MKKREKNEKKNQEKVLMRQLSHPKADVNGPHLATLFSLSFHTMSVAFFVALFCLIHLNSAVWMFPLFKSVSPPRTA